MRKRYLKSGLYILFCLMQSLLVTGCGHSSGSMGDYIIPLYEPRYAGGFSLNGKEGSESSLLSVSNPWQGTASVASMIFIDKDGHEVPLSFPGQILNGKAQRIVAMSSTHVAMLDALGATDKIVGVSGIDYVTNPYIQKHRDTIVDVGFEGNIDYEALLSSNPDLVLLYGVDGANSMEGKLKELQIPFVYIGDYLEENPLGKAEWIVAMGELIGERRKGEIVFKDIADRYEALKAKVADCVIDAPSVMLNVPYGDSWFMPSSKGYMATLISDAGGEYIYNKDTGNVSAPIDLEEAYSLASQADFWLNTDRITTMAELKTKCPKFTDTRVFKNGYVYNNTKRANSAGGNDFFESGAVMPDVMLRDLVDILHPELSSDTLFYYQKLQ